MLIVFCILSQPTSDNTTQGWGRERQQTYHHHFISFTVEQQTLDQTIFVNIYRVSQKNGIACTIHFRGKTLKCIVQNFIKFISNIDSKQDFIGASFSSTIFI